MAPPLTMALALLKQEPQQQTTKPRSSSGFSKILLKQLEGYLSAAKPSRASLKSMDTKLSKTFGVTFETT